MDILGIGVPELVFILIIALIVLGPKDMQKAGKTVGSWLNKVVKSEEWKGITNASRKLKTLPNELMRDANLDELTSDLSGFSQYRNDKVKVTMPKEDYGAWGGRPAVQNAIAPPIADEKTATPVDAAPASAKPTDAQPKPDTDNSAPIDTDNA